MLPIHFNIQLDNLLQLIFNWQKTGKDTKDLLQRCTEFTSTIKKPTDRYISFNLQCNFRARPKSNRWATATQSSSTWVPESAPRGPTLSSRRAGPASGTLAPPRGRSGTATLRSTGSSPTGTSCATSSRSTLLSGISSGGLTDVSKGTFGSEKVFLEF